jgi:hypothetical protein
MSKRKDSVYQDRLGATGPAGSHSHLDTGLVIAWTPPLRGIRRGNNQLLGHHHNLGNGRIVVLLACALASSFAADAHCDYSASNRRSCYIL